MNQPGSRFLWPSTVSPLFGILVLSFILNMLWSFISYNIFLCAFAISNFILGSPIMFLLFLSHPLTKFGGGPKGPRSSCCVGGEGGDTSSLLGNVQVLTFGVFVLCLYFSILLNCVFLIIFQID